MQVVKLGGSLSHSHALTDCLNVIADNPCKKTVIVPGGGDFANQVRFAQQRWQFNDEIAHEMAILAMQQMALVFKGLHPNFKLATSLNEIKQLLLYHNVIIWSPAVFELNQAAIKAIWDITSDSLAAWLAGKLDAEELIVVKAAPVNSTNLKELILQGVIDAAFTDFVKYASFSFHILNQQHFYEQQFANR